MAPICVEVYGLYSLRCTVSRSNRQIKIWDTKGASQNINTVPKSRRFSSSTGAVVEAGESGAEAIAVQRQRVGLVPIFPKHRVVAAEEGVSPASALPPVEIPDGLAGPIRGALSRGTTLVEFVVADVF